MSASIPQQVQTWLTNLRTQASQATDTFGADASEVTKARDGRVTVTLYFVASDSTPSDSKPLTPADIRASEGAAVDAAEQLRQYGASTQVHSEGPQTRVIGVFDAPESN